ncbi:MAG: hypothetical protein H7255_17540 [Ramlibacter sp.]|nr:hypothetical protein [Ramlibacter sp.]
MKMTTLSIKDIPQQWVALLLKRAARNQRSLEAELKAILESALLAEIGDHRPATHAGSAGSSVWRNPAPLRVGKKRIEQIALEHRQRFPRPIVTGPSATDIIREDRDSH